MMFELMMVSLTYQNVAITSFRARAKCQNRDYQSSLANEVVLKAPHGVLLIKTH